MRITARITHHASRIERQGLSALLPATLCVSACLISHAADLPLGHKDFVPTPQHPVGWRGDGTGVFPDATPPTQWDASGKGVLWRVTMPHQTLASPIAVRGKVITLADPHTILCYDASTGKRLWYNAQDTFDLLCKDPAEAKKLRRLYDLYHRHFTKPQAGTPGVTWNSKDTSGLDLVAEKKEAEQELRTAGIDPADTRDSKNHSCSHPFFDKYGLVAFTDLGMASTMSTPVSDGVSVWVLWSATRTIACYNVETGKCRWMRWLGPHAPGVPGFNFNSPLLVEGVLVVRNEDRMSGIEPSTGMDIWNVDLTFKDRPKGSRGMNEVGKYSAETPVLATIDGRKALILYYTTAIEAKTGAVIFPGAAWPREACGPKTGPCFSFGTSPFLGGPDTIVQLPGKYGDIAARRFSPQGVGALLWGAKVDPVDGYVDEDTGPSLAYDGYMYLNDSGTSALIEIATGNLIPRGISGPNGHYPGCNVAGRYFFNFDGAASCTVTTLGPKGGLISINHSIAGYNHTKRLGNAQGHTMKNSKGMTPEWWTQCFAARDEGVIGWVGRTHTLAAGEMTAGPFFQGDRIFLRTHTELICIGPR